jgi:transposase InsO family protein
MTAPMRSPAPRPAGRRGAGVKRLTSAADGAAFSCGQPGWWAAPDDPATGTLVAVDTFFAGVLKGVGKVYLQTAIDCFSRYAWARLYANKLPLTKGQLLNNDVLLTCPVSSDHG